MADYLSPRWHRCLLALLAIVFPCLLAASSTIPAPIVISPSQYWEGNDGPWSSFVIQVGNPHQNVRVLISTAGTATWVVVPEGCTVDGPSNCATLRGQEFNLNASSSWKFNNYYDLALESNLGYTGSGEYGFDTVGIDWQGSGGPILDHQVVAGIATQEFWLGSFGLTPRPTNFTDFNDPQPSFMETLKNKSMIPSLSWAYTAGAPYRFEKVLGSLVFGGYDLSKAGPTNMSFSFAPDISRDLTVGLQAVTMSAHGKSSELLPRGIFTFIDSTIPHIWLPLAACQEFEKAFGLTWNDTVGLYLVNDTLHEILVSQNASLTFRIGNTTQEAPTINITLPYASFDLTVSYPIVENSTRYFPLLRAANDTQYTLGRTFLQEAYLTVDYERSEFYLSQRVFDPAANEHIIPIQPPNSTSTDPPADHSLSKGAIAGIAIASVIFVACVALAVWFLLKRRRDRKSKIAAQNQGEEGYPPEKKDSSEEIATVKAELDAKDTASPGVEIAGLEIEKFELPAAGHASQEAAQSSEPPPPPEPVYEMIGDGANVAELPAEIAELRHEVA